ncbi:hypothetical protein OROHE_021244 [Orobanche hederae]
MDPLIPSNNFSPDAVLTGASVVPPVPPVVKPVTPSDSSANGPDPKAPTFAALVSNKKVDVERIGSTDFSGPLPTAVFTKEECENVSVIYKNALIGKFSFGKPDNFAIANCLFNNGFGKCKVQFLNFKHALISLQNEDEYTRLWLKREFNVLGFPMRLFKWDPFFYFKQEPALVPIWVKIMALPLQWFDLGALQTIGSLMGTFLKADPMTINRSRLDYARICVEVNLKNNPPKSRDRSVWYTVGKGKKVAEASVSDNGTLVTNNGFTALESLEEEEPRPPPADYNVFSAIPPHIPLPPFVFGDCNNLGDGDVPVLFNFRSSGGDEKGSSGPETHRGSHQDSLKNPNELELSSSEDDTEQTDDKAHQDGVMSDPSFNASSNCSGAEGDLPGSPRILVLLFSVSLK